jgi:hypothetical protein
MKIKDMFYLYSGNDFELKNMDTSENSNTNFVSRTSQNNGVVAKVSMFDGVQPFKSGMITVALGGSVLSSFVQLKPFYTAYHIKVLEPKSEMSLLEKLYWCTCIKANAFKYAYGRQANITLADIELPDIVPEWVYTSRVDLLKTHVKYKELDKLMVNEWKYVKLGDLFHIFNGKKYPKIDRIKGKLPLVSTSAFNNGITDHIEEKKPNFKKIITVAYSGSVGATFYHENDVFVGETVLALLPKFKINKYLGIFLCSVLSKHNVGYTYGRKIKVSNYLNDHIKLPFNVNNTPDWEYMENYIKSLPYSDRI